MNPDTGEVWEVLHGIGPNPSTGMYKPCHTPTAVARALDLTAERALVLCRELVAEGWADERPCLRFYARENLRRNARQAWRRRAGVRA